MKFNAKQVFSILKIALTDEQIDFDVYSLTEEEWKSLYLFALEYDVCALVAYGLKKLNYVNKDNLYAKKLNQESLKAIYRYEQQNYDLEVVSNIFESSKIPFITLKGAEIRKYYKMAYLRTSCDIDILIEKKNLDKATKLLINECDYKKTLKNSHDCSFTTPSGMNIELHFELIEEGWAKSSNSVLSDIFAHSTLADGYKYKRLMKDEYFYFYHIAHMAKHFENGGCGIRPFIDLYVLDNLAVDFEKRLALLKEGKLLTFAQVLKGLNGVWFNNEEQNSLLKQVEEFILNGGLYGTMENRVAIKQNKRGGKFKYVMSRIFLSYEDIKSIYPVLEKHKWLTPLFEVVRWFKLIFCGKLKKGVKEFKHSQSLSKEQTVKTKEFLENIGL